MTPFSMVAAMLTKYQQDHGPVVAFDPAIDRLWRLDLTAANTALTSDVTKDTASFTSYIHRLLEANNCRYAIGGYAEVRTIYDRSELFGEVHQEAGSNSEAALRRLHLGMDIWGAVGTPVFAFMGGMIHSFAFNDRFGDYGATLILTHQLDGVPFYSLYGHIQLSDIATIAPGQYVSRGQLIAHFGDVHENGHWPPHLHFQIIADLEGKEGDYPGVCCVSDKDRYLNNCPDPDLVLQWNRYL